MTPVLTLSHISKSFGNIQALKRIGFELFEEELLVVLGPTGVGKTTLLRTIAGLETPDTGNIIYRGNDITTQTPSERDVALVFQNFSLYPNKTVYENLAFPLQAKGRNLNQSEIDKRVSNTAEILRISHLLNRPATHLSGGEMQRVAIGRAIVRRPRIFLMDEPLTNLDAKLRELLRVEIIRLQRDLKTPMIYVTHDQTEALSMADRLIVLSGGQILQTGSPENIYNAPASPEIARQLGSPPINLLNATWHDGNWKTETGLQFRAKDHSCTTATLGIRPENIRTTGGESPATIEIIEEMGPSTILLVNWCGVHVHILTSAPSPHHKGETIYPTLSPEQVIIWPR